MPPVVDILSVAKMRRTPIGRRSSGAFPAGHCGVSFAGGGRLGRAKPNFRSTLGYSRPPPRRPRTDPLNESAPSDVPWSPQACAIRSPAGGGSSWAAPVSVQKSLPQASQSLAHAKDRIAEGRRPHHDDQCRAGGAGRPLSRHVACHQCVARLARIFPTPRRPHPDPLTEMAPKLCLQVPPGRARCGPRACRKPTASTCRASCPSCQAPTALDAPQRAPRAARAGAARRDLAGGVEGGGAWR